MGKFSVVLFVFVMLSSLTLNKAEENPGYIERAKRCLSWLFEEDEAATVEPTAPTDSSS